jgi:hypothetical protein
MDALNFLIFRMTAAETVIIIREAQIIFICAILIRPGQKQGAFFKGIKLKKKTPYVMDPIIFKPSRSSL